MKELVKLYYRIGEVSQIVGVQPHVLRYWESEFRTIRPQKSSKGQRVYSRKDVEKLLRVKDLLRNQGFTIAGARRRLAQGGVGHPGRASAASAEATPPASPIADTPSLADVTASTHAAAGLSQRTGDALAAPAVDVPDGASTQNDSVQGASGPRGLASPAVPAAYRAPLEHPVVEGAGQCCGELPREAAPLVLGESRRADRHARSMRRALMSVRVELTALLSQLSEPVS